MPNPYWDGTRQAHLDRSQITASWGARGTAHSGASIAFVNRAFEIYYQALQKIGECPDPDQSRQMLESLHDAARTGWGWGVSDLEEAFEHLHSNGGRWTDEDTKNYYGGRDKVFQRGIVTAPVSIVNFMNAVDDRVSELRSVMENYQRQTRDLARAQEADDWERVGTILGEVKSWGERAKPLVWFAPRVERGVSGAVSLAGALGRIHTGLTTYTRAREAGFDSGTATALTALRTAVGWVPVLGDFYGKAVEMIPGLTIWFRNLIRDHTARIDRASRAH